MKYSFLEFDEQKNAEAQFYHDVAIMKRLIEIIEMQKAILKSLTMNHIHIVNVQKCTDAISSPKDAILREIAAVENKLKELEK